MACEMRETIIDGERWSTMQLSATRALALESRLLPVVLQAIAPALEAVGKSEAEQVAAIGSAFAAASRAMPPAEFAALVRELCSEAFRDDRRVDFERDFSGGRGVMLRYRVAWFVLEANFADFFAALLPEGVVDRARAVMAQRMASGAAASTGESGDFASRSRRSAA